jgi:hypothetical protein
LLRLFWESLVAMHLMVLYVHPVVFTNKRPFESEGIGTNRETWGNMNVEGNNLSFPIPQHFISYYCFSFSFNSLFCFSFVSFYFKLEFSLVGYLTFINFLLRLVDTKSYNHSLVQIHFGSQPPTKRLFAPQKIIGNQYGSMCLLYVSLEHGFDFGSWLQLRIYFCISLMNLDISSIFGCWVACSHYVQVFSQILNYEQSPNPNSTNKIHSHLSLKLGDGPYW